MHYQKRLILSYATVVFLLSIILGSVFFCMNYRYQTDRMERNMQTASNQVLLEVEDELERMDEVIRYMLSDNETLESILLLSKVSEGKVPISYSSNARQIIFHRMGTDFIYKNTYRVVYYNPLGETISSYTPDDHSRKEAIKSSSLKDYEYLKLADITAGKNITVGIHKDIWGKWDGPEVISRVKKIQGENLGYIEVEKKLEDFEKIRPSDEEVAYAVLDGDRILYHSQNVTAEEREFLKTYREKQDLKDENLPYKIAISEAKGLGIRVISFRSMSDIKKENMTIVYSAIILTLVVFFISLFFVILWSRYLAKPISSLTQIVENTDLETLKDTTFDHKIFSNSTEEVKLLAESFVSLKGRLDKSIRNEKRISLLQMQAQFDTLQAQVNPHFIYNVLNIISSKGILSDDESIANMCGALADMLRYSTDNKDRYASIKKEMDYLKKYLYLIQERNPNRLEIHWQVEEQIVDNIIPKMVLQQVVENSVNHGLKNTIGKMSIEICGYKTKRGWRIAVSDNGCGFDKNIYDKLLEELKRIKENILSKSMSPELEIGGMGLINTYARCLFLYNVGTVFEIENSDRGVSVTIGEER